MCDLIPNIWWRGKSLEAYRSTYFNQMIEALGERSRGYQLNLALRYRGHTWTLEVKHPKNQQIWVEA